MTITQVERRPDVPGHSHGLDVIRQRELERSLGSAGAWAVESLSDEQFQLMLELDRKRQVRTQEIVMNRLQKGTWEEGADYGVVPGITKPFCWESGADKIAQLFRWNALPTPATFTYDGEVLTASVTVTVYDLSGRALASDVRSCSTRELRFKNKKTGKWKFGDPRECANECAAMASKRAKIAAVLSAAGAKKYFANPDLLQGDTGDGGEGGEAEEEGRRPRFVEWTSDERQAFVEEARRAGFRSGDEVESFVRQTLGRLQVGTGKDVETLMAALAARRAEAGEGGTTR